MKNKIIIVNGDHNSVNSEILYKTWKKLNAQKSQQVNKIQAAQSQSQMSFNPLYLKPNQTIMISKDLVS